MCSIVLGTDCEKVKELVNLNKVRGTYSSSKFIIHQDTYELYSFHKQFGELDLSDLYIPENYFAIIHQQAPTTAAKTIDNIHPSIIDDSYLWHNGIIKDNSCNKIRNQYKITDVWDTKLLHHSILDSYESLSEIDGSFACIEYIKDSNTIIFRNEIAPLYFDNKSFSSTKFEGSREIEPNKVFELIFLKDYIELNQIGKFKTKLNPYYFGD